MPLLRSLAEHNPGLCLVTTREYLPDIQHHYDKTAQDWDLDKLTNEAGAALLYEHGVRRAGARRDLRRRWGVAGGEQGGSRPRPHVATDGAIPAPGPRRRHSQARSLRFRGGRRRDHGRPRLPRPGRLRKMAPAARAGGVAAHGPVRPPRRPRLPQGDAAPGRPSRA